YDKILLSPGPGVPQEAGLLPALLERYATHKSILGVCLGHQAIAEAFGATLENLQEVVHGKDSDILVTSPTETLFHGLPQTFRAGRYHSWVVSHEQLPSCLEVTAKDPQGHIMALRHQSLDLTGIQFHPESVLTHHGKDIIANWLTT
ncbi:MAG: aminodeoxychorismate/anthranilate synthase component II, partial [Myxococcota bacterium]